VGDPSKDPNETEHGKKEEFDVDEIEFHVDTPGPVMQEGIAREYSYARLGLIIGALTVAVGGVFIILGYSGSVDITFQAGSNTGHVVTGSLGVVIALIGLGILYWTRPKVGTTGQKTRSNITKKSKGK